MKNRPSLTQIKKASKNLFRKNLWDSKRGKREIVRERQVTHYVANKIYKYSQTATGLALGEYEAANILHSSRVIENELEEYPDIKNKVSQLVFRLKVKNTPSKESMLKDLLKSKMINVHIKIELRRIFLS